MTEACKIGASRELMEETGLEIPTSRLRLVGTVQNRLFFAVKLSDELYSCRDKDAVESMEKGQQHLKVCVSCDHFLYRVYCVSCTAFTVALIQ